MSNRWEVPSSDGQRTYVVLQNDKGEWSCSCVGWIHHYPRRDCKHIRGKKAEIGFTEQTKVDIHDQPVAEAHASLVRSLKASINSNQTASELAIAKREEVEKKKAVKLSEFRYGFQLAYTYQSADFVPGMVAEVKYDGELGMLIDNKLINRSGNDITNRFPEFEKTDKAVLVGEIVILEENGLSNFKAMQERNTDDPMKIKLRSQLRPAVFVAFDILEDRNLQKRHRDLTNDSFETRRRHLEDFLKRNPLKGVQLIEQLPITGNADIEKLLATMRELGGEGFMIKNPTATYRAVRGRNWLKVKTWQEEEFDIVRFEDTGIGDGFVIYVMSGKHEQRVACNSYQMRERVRAGHKHVEIKFLSKGEDGALRFPSLRRLV